MAKYKNNRPILKEHEIIDALKASHGIIAGAAQMLGVTGPCISLRLKRSKKLRDAHEEICERFTDFVESKLFEKIAAGDLKAIIFYLKCRARDRGYVEKHDLNVKAEIQIEKIERVIIDPNPPVIEVTSAKDKITT